MLGVAAARAQDACMLQLAAGLILLLSALAVATAHAADEVTIYRCTDAAGRLTLRDTPCARNQKQQARSMLRPKDAPAPPRGVLPSSSRERAPYGAQPPRVMVINAPRPLYECITPDGDAYTSDSGEGHPRWVPLWTLYPTAAFPAPGMASSAGLSITHGGVRIDGRRTVLYPPAYGMAAYGAGTWIRDDCHALPQDDVCARLVDRRDELRRRFFNAMPSERDVLRVEERSINARLDNDCGTH